MNRIVNMNMLGVLGGLAVAAPSLGQVCAFNCVIGADGGTKVERQIVLRAGVDGDGAHSVQVDIEDGNVMVILDGEEIDADQIKLDGHRVLVLGDEDGEWKSIDDLMHNLHGLDFKFEVGDGENGVWFGQGAPFGRFGKQPSVMVGLSMSPVDEELRDEYGLEEGESTLVVGVTDGLPADKAGVREGDIIIEINGDGPASSGAISEALQDLEPGDRIRFTVLRDGREKTVNVKVTEYDGKQLHGSVFIDKKGGHFELDAKDMPFGKLHKILVSPDHNGFFELAPDAMHEHFGTILKGHAGDPTVDIHRFFGAPDNDQIKDYEDRIGELTDRIAELEEMLDRVLEQLDDAENDG